MRNGPALVALLLLASTGCVRCGRTAAVPPERLLPADVSFVLVVPRLRVAQEQAAAVALTAATFPAAADLSEAVAAAKSQLGLDPLDPRAVSSAGIDPERGLAAARTADGALVLVLPARDASRLEDTVARLARDRLGASRREVARERGLDVTTFRAEGEPEALSLLVTGGNILLAAGPGGPARLAALAQLAEPASLQRSAPYARACAALGVEPPVMLFAPPGSPALARWPILREGGALGLSGGSTRLAAAAVLLLGPERRQAWRGALASPSGAAAELPAMPSDAFAVGRLAGDPAPLLRRALAAAPSVQGALVRAGLDAERDLLACLAPGAVAALALAPTFDVAAVSRGAEGAVSSDPFRLVLLTAALAVADETQARAALDRLARTAPALGLVATPRAGADRPGWRFARGTLAIDVAVDGRRLLLAGGPGRLEAALAGGAGRYAAPTADARAALAGDATGLVIDLGQLVASFRALPATAYGSGPNAFVMRSLAERVIDPAARLVAASARASMKPEGARIDLLVEARRPEVAR